jgi:hypothetical protein
MKKVIIALSCVAIGFASCSKMFNKHEKDEKTEVTNESFVLAAGETLTYTLPLNASDDAYAITVAPKNAAASNLATEVFTYTMPTEINAATFSDDVTIANVEEAHNGIAVGGCQGGGGANAQGGKGHHGSHDTEIERTINIHITAKGATTGRLATPVISAAK